MRGSEHIRSAVRDGIRLTKRTLLLVVLALISVLLECECQRESGHLDKFYVGLGDRLGWLENGQMVRWYERAEADGLRFELVEIWLTKGWDTTWVSSDDLQKIVDRGYIPVIVHYYFGDSISVECVLERVEAWYEDIERLASLIDIDAEVWVVLEPEFNDDPPPGETPITEWEGWNDLVIGAVQRIRERAPQSKISLCAGDFQVQNLELCMSEAAAILDFLSFQEMRASTYPQSSWPSYLRVADSALQFSSYLRDTFRRPILLAYLAVSTYAHGDPRGWEDEQASVIGEMMDRAPELLANEVFGLVYLEYYDDPEHGGFFGEAEKYWGLVDSDGDPKLGWWVWKEKTQRTPPIDSGLVKRALP